MNRSNRTSVNWMAKHPRFHSHYTPTHASWLNQPEIRFSILTRSVLRNLSAISPVQVRDAIDRLTGAANEHPVPFQWTKSAAGRSSLKPHYADLRQQVLARKEGA